MPAFILSRALTAAALTTVGARRLLCTYGPPALELPTGLFGCLTVSAPDRAIEVASLDPRQHTDIGRVVVPDSAEAPGLRSERRGERDWLVEAASGGRRPLRVMVPVPMDLCLSSRLGCSLSVVENRSIEISSTASPGNSGPRNSSEESLLKCRLDRVKSGQVSVTSETGRASLELSRTLLESLVATARDGLSLTASMYQGKEISLESSQGPVAVEANAVYCRQFSLSGAQASLHCGSAHGDFSLTASDTGSLRLDSLEGSLQVKMLYGDARLHLTRPGQINVELGEGSVSLGLQKESQAASPSSNGFLLDVTASGIDLDEELSRLLSDCVFPLGPNSVRLVAQLPGDFVGADAAECRVRVLNGRVQIACHRESGVFAEMVARSSHATASTREQ